MARGNSMLVLCRGSLLVMSVSDDGHVWQWTIPIFNAGQIDDASRARNVERRNSSALPGMQPSLFGKFVAPLTVQASAQDCR